MSVMPHHKKTIENRRGVDPLFFEFFGLVGFFDPRCILLFFSAIRNSRMINLKLLTLKFIENGKNHKALSPIFFIYRPFHKTLPTLHYSAFVIWISVRFYERTVVQNWSSVVVTIFFLVKYYYFFLYFDILR